MNYYDARELRDKPGRWHYTCQNDNRIWPVGYCADPASPCHEAGHDLPEDAMACYKRHVLDTDLHFENPENPVQLQKCAVCQEWTGGWGGFRFPASWVLCPVHQTRETVDHLLGDKWPGQIVSSL